MQFETITQLFFDDCNLHYFGSLSSSKRDYEVIVKLRRPTVDNQGSDSSKDKLCSFASKMVKTIL